MDHTARTEAYKTAKALITSHGVVRYMNKYSRDLLSREVTVDSTALRYEFILDPTRDSWSASNPTCSLSVVYVPETRGARVADDGAVVIDSNLRVTLGLSGSDMTTDVARQRESMVSMLMMLCEMLEATLPKQITSLVETPEQAAEKKKRAFEQAVGQQIVDNIGLSALKGLRSDGTARSFRLTGAYTSSDGKYPEAGTYHFKRIRLTDRRGRPKDITHYSIRVFGTDGTAPPTVSVRRLGSNGV